MHGKTPKLHIGTAPHAAEACRRSKFVLLASCSSPS